jgi:probable rRNA maturation factor
MTAEPPSFRSAPQRVGHAGTVEVFVADEQSDVAVAVDRYAKMASFALDQEGVRGDVEFALLFVTEAVMAELNQIHMGHDGPTDVLAFPIDDEMFQVGRSPDGGSRRPPTRDPLHLPGPRLLGDVVVCPAVAATNSTENAGSYPGHDGSAQAEIDLLVIHGILHVLGHDHAEDDEKAVMQKAERRLLVDFASQALQ